MRRSRSILRGFARSRLPLSPDNCSACGQDGETLVPASSSSWKMEKACGSTIWRTCPSDVQGYSERVLATARLNPCAGLYRKACRNRPHALERRRFDIPILNGTKLVHAQLRLTAGGRETVIPRCSLFADH